MSLPHLNWLDLALLLILAVSVWTSFRKGLSREIIGLVSVLAGMILGLWFYGSAGIYFGRFFSSRLAANCAGFFAIFCGVLVLGSLISFLVGKFLRVTGLSIVDHLMGAGFGLLRGALVAVVLITGILAFSPDNRPPEAVVHSTIAPYVVGGARVFAAMAPHELKEGFRKTYAQVKSAWEKALEKGVHTQPQAEKEEDARKI